VHGNVWEWCLDGYLSRYGFGRPNNLDELIADRGIDRVCRGGCYSEPALNAASAYPARQSSTARGGNLGTRAARSLAIGE
jgi:formylglycine-generating enzyme required for sulfatase activity